MTVTETMDRRKESKKYKQGEKVTEGIIPVLEEWWISGFLDSSRSLLYAAVATPFQSHSAEMLKSFNKVNLMKRSSEKKNSFNNGPSGRCCQHKH